MFVKKIVLSNFRNIENAVYEPSKGVNVICGDNGQGKTNIIEALWMLAGMSSFRALKTDEVITYGKNIAALSAEINAGEDDIRTAGFEIVRDGISPKRELCDDFKAVLFFPECINIISGSAEKRRRFLDDALCQLMPKYKQQLSRYKKALKMRTALLKECREIGVDEMMFPIWDKAVYEAGAYITFIRATYVKKLAEKAAVKYKEISADKETLNVEYVPFYGIDGKDHNRFEIATMLKNALLEARKEDLEHLTNSCGPHKDDVSVTLDGKSTRSFASQGQMRCALIAMKLAEFEIFKTTFGYPPVLLLDDVFGELDGERRETLIRAIKDTQIFITCCDETNRYRFDKAIKVIGGTISDFFDK
jgi:DNA replication and repair protein RecF